MVVTLAKLKFWLIRPVVMVDIISEVTLKAQPNMIHLQYSVWVEPYRISYLCSGREGRGLHFPVVLQLFPPYSLQNLALLNLSLSSFHKEGLISDFSPLFEYLNYSVHSKQPQKYIYFLSILVEIVARGPLVTFLILLYWCPSWKYHIDHLCNKTSSSTYV